MKRLSVKLGILFCIIIFSLMTFMFFFLHTGIVETRVEEELSALQARGNSHRAILEKRFDSETIEHVVLMESESTTDVVVTDQSGKILGSSAEIHLFQDYLQRNHSDVSWKGKVIENNWKEESYIATISPVQLQEERIGHVYMFQDTASVHSLIQRLNEHFKMAGLISVFLTFIIIIFLSRGITKPLIKMKEATAQISKGDFSVSLPKTSKDELGDLAHSIEALANDLGYLKQKRNEFLASISHELRTPLTYIKGYADILLKRSLDSEDREKYLTIIVKETDRLSQLMKELFELAKIDQNSFVIQKEQIELEPFIKKLQEKLSPAFQEKRITLEADCQPQLTVCADPLRLEQILFNLLDNAKKYSQEDTKVTLKGWKSKNFIHLSVKDNGKGIPEQDIPYIFNRFYRVDKARTRSLGGTGLGLSIVKELIHAHGAEIKVKSEENAGTEIEIIFHEGETI